MDTDWKNRVAVVTGANSGIGLRVVEHLLAMDMVVVGLDKATHNIKNTDGKLHALEVDITNDLQVSRAFDWIDEHLGGLDVLVNNAGLGGVSPLIEGKAVEWRKLLDVNVVGLAQCTAEAIRVMRKRNISHGQIINMSSNLAHHVPAYAPFHFYSATKHAVKALTEGFRQELRNIETPIRISSVAPGLVKTEIFKKSLGDQMDKIIYDKYPSIDPSDIAAAIEYILKTPHHVNVFEISVKPIRAEN